MRRMKIPGGGDTDADRHSWKIWIWALRGAERSQRRRQCNNSESSLSINIESRAIFFPCNPNRRRGF